MKAHEDECPTRHEAIGLLMAIELSCRSLKRSLPIDGPQAEDVVRIEAVCEALKAHLLSCPGPDDG